MHNFAFSRPSKSDFTITSLVGGVKTIRSILLKFFVVLDISLVILNPFLFCKYLINSWNCEKPRIMLFYVKKTKKVTIHSNFAEFFRTPLWSEGHDYGLKLFLKGLEFFSALEFFKNDFRKKLLRIKKSVGLWGPPLGVAGVNWHAIKMICLSRSPFQDF